ncbi:dihydrofolate reductase family protein [Arthrobacter sp. Br18]|uniref:dihydrofolate reductase family protein n=1 Tax=Arthrobacter sp. Br18 TaxID=1312954 RepID=UPI00047B488A|nr:dihydrofolate reductase family protein [Arthrobacter sp. Br18]
MRKVTAGLFSSVDGVVESPHLWQFDSFDDELGAGMDAMIATTDTVILGRGSYQEWSDYWPKAQVDDDFAGFINPVEKFVASRTLQGSLEWENSHRIEGELEAFVRDLKDAEGRNISVCGSISVVRQLLFADLLDSLMLMVHPVIAGSGRRLFEAGDPVTRLTLQDSTITSKGNAILTYGVRRP